eukprot:268952-Pelagomonas_calceolata.AAC.1
MLNSRSHRSKTCLGNGRSALRQSQCARRPLDRRRLQTPGNEWLARADSSWSRQLVGVRLQTRAVWDGENNMSIADLRSQLNAALEVEDYKAAADLRDSIQ